MPKHTPFFKFDSSAWLGGSIQFTDLETKGLFIDLCALYWESQEPIQIDAKLRIRLRCPEGTLSNLIDTLSDLEVITKSEQGITIPFLDKLLNERREWLKKCSEYGKKSKGTSSNKKEERRKKKEDSRENNKEKIDNKKQVFDRFRVLYPGSKRGLDVEFENFQKKNKDWQTVVMDLEELLRLQITKREAAKVAGAFVPQWKNLSTYINQKCWSMEENFEVPQQVNSIPQQQSQYQKTLDDWILSSKPTNAQIAAIERKLAEQPLIPPEALYNAFKRELRNEAYPDLFKIIEKLKKTHKPMSEAERKQKEEFAEMQRRDREAGRI